jgi:hypothetical protein
MFMAVELSKSPSYQPGTPELLFRIRATPQGNAGVGKSITRDGRQFVVTLLIPYTNR